MYQQKMELDENYYVDVDRHRHNQSYEIERLEDHGDKHDEIENLRPNKIELDYLKILNEFYYKCTDNNIEKIIKIIDRDHKISLRVLDLFLLVYCRDSICEELKNIRKSFIINKKLYRKIEFGVFRRQNKFIYCFKNNTSMNVATTFGQLLFFKWAIENNVINYIESNYDEIYKLLNNIVEKEQKIIKQINIY